MKLIWGKKEEPRPEELALTVPAPPSSPPATVEQIEDLKQQLQNNGQLYEALKQALQTTPRWVDVLRHDLDHVAEAMGDLGDFRKQAKEDRAAVKGMAESFSQLERIVNTGRACVNCNETRRELFDELDRELTRIYGMPASEDLKPEAYSTRSQAYQAGRQYVIAQLRNVIARVKESRSISPDRSWMDQNPASL